MKPSLIAAAGLAVGLGAGFLLFGRGAGTPGTPSPPPVAAAPAPGTSPASLTSTASLISPDSPEPGAWESVDLAALREELAREVARRVALEAEITELRKKLAAGAGDVADSDREPDASEPAGADSESPPGDGWIDESVLLSGGFDPGEAADVRERLEELELERLFVRDQAAREGWLRKPRFFNEMVRIGLQQAALRDEYGDDGYDWILYASGRNNRVVVGAVLRDSPAGQVGLEGDDVVVAYANRRILEIHELQNATQQGEPGDNVALDVERDGEPLRFYLPAGPIGIRPKMLRQLPSAPR